MKRSFLIFQFILNKIQESMRACWFSRSRKKKFPTANGQTWGCLCVFNNVIGWRMNKFILTSSRRGECFSHSLFYCHRWFWICDTSHFVQLFHKQNKSYIQNFARALKISKFGVFKIYLISVVRKQIVEYPNGQVNLL